MPIHTPTPCPARHNDAWRRAEAAGEPHDLTPVWGSPLHCLGCQGRAHHQLGELPELLAAVFLEAIHGTAPKSTGTIGRIGLRAPWPGERARLLTDHIVGAMLDLEDDVRELRHLNHRPARGTEGAIATGAVQFLTVHLEWMLAHHPAATEPYDRDSANPGSQIASWHRMAERFTRRDALRVQMTAPCPRCDLRTLAREDGSDYVECQNGLCGTLLTPAEYAVHAGEVAAEEQDQRVA